MTAEWVKFGKPSVLGIVTGMMVGLGTITPCSGYVGPAGALVIGLLAGVICFTATQIVKRKLVIDDSLDVFPVHGVGGMLGTLIVAVFASPELGIFGGQGFGIGNDSIGQQFVVQLIAVASVVAYTAVLTFVILKATGFITSGIRVTREEETQGLDIVLNEESGYNL